jgi:hypothetical protein
MLCAWFEKQGVGVGVGVDARFHRWPFNEEMWMAVRRDVQCFARTYKVEKLNRCSDTTLEVKPYERKTLTVERRNHILMGVISADRSLLFQALGCPTLLEAYRMSAHIENIGQFVFKNILTVLALCPEAQLHVQGSHGSLSY